MRYPTPEEWPNLIAEFRQSGLTQKEFVAKHDIPHSTFQYWLYVRSKRLSADSKLSRKFLPLEVVTSPALKARAAGASSRPASRAESLSDSRSARTLITLSSFSLHF